MTRSEVTSVAAATVLVYRDPALCLVRCTLILVQNPKSYLIGLVIQAEGW